MKPKVINPRDVWMAAARIRSALMRMRWNTLPPRREDGSTDNKFGSAPRAVAGDNEKPKSVGLPCGNVVMPPNLCGHANAIKRRPHAASIRLKSNVRRDDRILPCDAVRPDGFWAYPHLRRQKAKVAEASTTSPLKVLRASKSRSRLAARLAGVLFSCVL